MILAVEWIAEQFLLTSDTGNCVTYSITFSSSNNIFSCNTIGINDYYDGSSNRFGLLCQVSNFTENYRNKTPIDFPISMQSLLGYTAMKNFSHLHVQGFKRSAISQRLAMQILCTAFPITRLWWYFDVIFSATCCWQVESHLYLDLGITQQHSADTGLCL